VNDAEERFAERLGEGTTMADEPTFAVGSSDRAAGTGTGRPALILHTQFLLFERRTAVVLNDAGIAWGRRGRPHEFAPWELVGGVRTPSRTQHILALDGSTLGTVSGWLIVDGQSEWSSQSVTLAHAVALYRPDLFVEIGDGMFDESACIRRDVVAFEAASGDREVAG
jgi:hypothetical protein